MARQNLAVNPKAGTNLSGWTKNTSFSIARLSNIATDFPPMAHVTTGVGLIQTAGGQYSSFEFTPDPTKTFWVSVWGIFRTTPAGDGLLITGNRKSGAVPAGGMITPIKEVGGTWWRHGFLLEPVDGSAHQIRFKTVGSVLATTLTALMIEEATADPGLPYRDGDYDGWMWDGPPNASTSTEVPSSKEFYRRAVTEIMPVDTTMRFGRNQ